MNQKPTEKELEEFVRQASVGSGLRLALTAQFEFATRLTKALIDSGALSAAAAQDVLEGTAKALDKHVVTTDGEPGKSQYFRMVVPHLASHQSGLRGIAKKLAPKPAAAAS